MAILLEQSVLSLSPNSTGLRKGSSSVLPRKKGTKYPLKCITFQKPPAMKATYEARARALCYPGHSVRSGEETQFLHTTSLPMISNKNLQVLYG